MPRGTPQGRPSPAPSPVAVVRRLARDVGRCVFGPPVACVYNPLDYAFGAHRTYLERYCRRKTGVLLVGMNPGPFGMVQTGVPFGEVAAVRDWLGIDGGVARPAIEHPKRPVQGFACTRSEVSGQRFWGWASARYGTPRAFFEEFFVWNYCPLAFMEESGRNRTPDKLPRHEREPLYAACDRALVDIVSYLNPRLVLGIGRYSEKRARAVLGATRAVHGVLHPSPASPAANRGWSAQFEQQLIDLGVSMPQSAKRSF